MSLKNSYNEDDAQEILRRAAALQSSGALTSEELIRTAAEAGISREAVEQAEAQIRSEKLDRELLGEFRRQQRNEFYSLVGGTAFFLVIAGALFFRDIEKPGWIYLGAGFFLLRLYKGVSRYLWERSPSWQRRYETWKAAEMQRHIRVEDRLYAKPVSGAEYEETIKGIIDETLPQGGKLDVIKELRLRNNISLHEAKGAVDDFYRRHPEQVRSQPY